MHLVLAFLFFSLTAFGQVRPFQTARTQATSGAGLGSLLVAESAFLNPASLAFFTNTVASYQNTKSSLKGKSDDRDTDGIDFPKRGQQEGYFMYDNSASTKGGFSYQYQREGGFTRKRGTATIATMQTETVGVGLTYRYTQDLKPTWSNDRHEVSHPVIAGVTWVASEKTIIGFTWDDPGRAIKGESRAMTGGQYAFTERLFAILDVGGDPTIDFYDSRIWRGALQYSPLDDFFIRVGKYQDRAINLEGESWGASWSGPKLGVDFAMKSSRPIRKVKGYLYPDEKITDVSFAANVQF